MDMTFFTIETDVPAETKAKIKRYHDRRAMFVLLDEDMRRRQDRRIARTMQEFAAAAGMATERDLATLINDTSEYRAFFLISPIIQNDYGANFTTGAALFLLARMVNPSVLVESGVYLGHSSYLFARACPSARIHAFDPDFSHVTYWDENVHYHAYDWTKTDIAAGGNGLVYFDCHQSQAARVVQAHGRGFRTLIFDDCWPVEAIGACGLPPLPSIDMVLEDSLTIGQTVRWAQGETVHTYVHTDEMQRLCVEARSLIKGAHDVPSLYRETGVAPTSALKLVQLVDRGPSN